MLRYINELRRYGLGLFGGYILLFLLLHVSPPSVGGVGILARAPGGYLEAAERINPIQQLLALLGPRQVTGFRMLLLLIFALIFGLYASALRAERSSSSRSPGIATIVAGVILFSFPLIFSPYIFAKDIYAYIMNGRITAIHGINPALTVPAAFPHDPYLSYMIYWKNEPSLYGPVWMLITHGVTLAVEYVSSSVLVYLLAYKLVALAAHLASSLLIWNILGCWRPQQQAWGALLYAWNPLALIEFAGSAHNDAIMVLLIVLGIWLAQRDRWRWAVVALMAAALIKWMPLILLSLYGLLLVRQQPTWAARIHRACFIAGLALVTAIGAYAPLGVNAETLNTIVTSPAMKQGQLGNSMYSFTKAGTQYLAGRLGFAPSLEQQEAVGDRVTEGLGWISKGIFTLIWLAGLGAIWRRPTFARFVQSSFWVLLLTLLFAAPYFWPWYVTWPLGLAALLDWRLAGRVMAAFTMTASLIYVAFPISSPPPLLLGARAAFTFLSVIGLLAYLLWKQGRSRHRFMPALLRGSQASRAGIRLGE